ncbi:MAG TPA: hypothetical protein VFV87_18525, partial [Pirellulaceae bacterium]|nr:hypothetical protein [Pirellulaceae bacterium]
MAKERRQPPAQPPAEPAGPVARWIGPLRRLPGWSSQHPLRAGLVAGGLLVAMIGLGAAAALVFRVPDEQDREELLAQALEALDLHDFRQARHLALQMGDAKSLPYGDQAGPLLIHGAVTAHEAEGQTDPTKRRVLYLVAARYLEEARSHGWPQGQEPRGLVLLGRALHHSGRYGESLPILREALAADPASAPQLHWLLTDSHLQSSPPRLDAALTHNREYLASPELTAHERHRGQLLQGDILLRQGQFEAAYVAAGEVPETASHHPDSVVLQGRVALAALAKSQPL